MEFHFNRLCEQFFARRHLQSLLPIQPFVLCICVENEIWKVRFSKDEFTFTKTIEWEDSDVIIKAGRQTAESLISGEIRLSQLKELNDIVYEGSFRDFLFLESVLWLCREYGEQAEAASY